MTSRRQHLTTDPRPKYLHPLSPVGEGCHANNVSTQLPTILYSGAQRRPTTNYNRKQPGKNYRKPLEPASQETLKNFHNHKLYAIALPRIYLCIRIGHVVFNK